MVLPYYRFPDRVRVNNHTKYSSGDHPTDAYIIVGTGSIRSCLRAIRPCWAMSGDGPRQSSSVEYVRQDCEAVVVIVQRSKGRRVAGNRRAADAGSDRDGKPA